MIAPEKISPADSGYPAALRGVFGELLPPDLWFIGNIGLLDGKAVGFCGSRNASEQGLDVAADCARQLGEAGIGVVSGYAPGVDMASHHAALTSGGYTIAVLPAGIDHFRLKTEIKSVWDWDRALVISHYPRNAIWRSYRAMERNRIMVAISEAVIVLEARDKGGTLHAGFCALKMNRPLFVALYNEMDGLRDGNRRLIDEGGTPLMRSRITHQAQLRKLFSVLGGRRSRN